MLYLHGVAHTRGYPHRVDLYKVNIVAWDRIIIILAHTWGTHIDRVYLYKVNIVALDKIIG